MINTAKLLDDVQKAFSLLEQVRILNARHKQGLTTAGVAMTALDIILSEKPLGDRTEASFEEAANEYAADMAKK